MRETDTTAGMGLRRLRLAALAAALLLAPAILAQKPAAISTVTYSVPGLRAPAEILVDPWGVPHLYAQNLDDIFFMQGFNAARDRLWQLDLWRRRGEGRLAEVFGPDYVEQDRAARLFLYRGDMHAEWLAYASDTKRIVTAFVNGINAYIRLVKHRPELLPPEFKLLGYRPALWTPETVVRIRSHGLFRNVESEVERAVFLREHGRTALGLREHLEPPHEVEVPDGLDLGLITPQVLGAYRLATSGVHFSADLGRRLEAVAPGAVAAAALLGSADEGEAISHEGSNNWAVAPARSATGRPLLANDPHRTITVPSLRYIAQLSAPGLDVIGAGEPALPGISIGHNQRVAFGLTVFSIDQEDLYVYRTNPEDPDEYRYQGHWEPMHIVTESIPVRGAAPQTVTLKFTRHGPVVFEDPQHHVAYAVRAAWLEPGMAPYLGSIEYMRAENWDAFLAAMNRWGAPSENQAYADVDGNIGWKPGGLAPIRPNWDGLLPVPGDGRYEWAGFLDMDELPQTFNPARGWVATANQMNLPAGYPHQLGFEWELPYRFQRISEVLAATPHATLNDMALLQTDTVCLPARRVLSALTEVRSDDPRVERALDFLRPWNRVLAADSGPAALFEIWFEKYLGPALWARIVSDPATLRDLGVGDEEARIALVEKPDARLGADPVAARNQAVFESLGRAVEETERLLGKDWKRWQWGRLHHALLEHPMSPLLDAGTHERWNVGPLPRGGGDETVESTYYRRSDFRQEGGASFRMVLDVGAWDNSVAMNSPGQSGDPAGPHYRDLFPLWAQDRSFPLLFTRARVQAVAEQRIRLEPAPTAPRP